MGASKNDYIDNENLRFNEMLILKLKNRIKELEEKLKEKNEKKLDT